MSTAAPYISKITPTIAELAGGTIITIRGMGFTTAFGNSSVECQFSTTPVSYAPATVQSEQVILCTLPNSTSLYGETVTVEISVNSRQRFTANGFTVSYYLPMVLTAVAPSAGPQAGGTVLTISGTDIRGSLPLFCGFGSAHAPVPATFIDSGYVICTTPSIVTAQVAPLYILNNNFTSANNLTFNFYPPPSVSSISPTLGIAAGGTLVTVSGQAFSYAVNIRCAFGSSKIMASSILNDTALVCASPPGVGGSVALEISPSSIDGSVTEVYTTNNVQFTYVALEVQTASPRAVVYNVAATLINVTGIGFSSANGGPWCRFGLGGPVNPAFFVSSTAIRCNATAVPLPVLVELEVTNDGVEYSSSGYRFAFMAPPNNGSIIPPWGVISTSVTVTVPSSQEAAASILANGITIHIGSAVLNDTDLSVNVTPWFVSVTFLVPSVGVTLGLNSIGMAVGTDPPRVLGDFSVVADPVISSVSPAIGSVAGGQVVTVTGSGFAASVNVMCQFGTSDRVVRARVINETLLECVAPFQAAAGVVAIQVSTCSGRRYSNSVTSSYSYLLGNASFTGYSQPEVRFLFPLASLSSLSPSSITTQGGAVLTITGSGFAYGYGQCVFAALTSVAAVFVSPTQVTCIAPSASTPGVVTVTYRNTPSASISNPLSVEYVALPRVTRLWPDSGPEQLSSSYSITVVGADFIKTADLACRIGAILSTATFISATQLLCLVPNGVPGPAVVAVTHNGIEFSTDSVSF